jgi:hypothetical protein
LEAVSFVEKGSTPMDEELKRTKLAFKAMNLVKEEDDQGPDVWESPFYNSVHWETGEWREACWGPEGSCGPGFHCFYTAEDAACYIGGWDGQFDKNIYGREFADTSVVVEMEVDDLYMSGTQVCGRGDCGLDHPVFTCSRARVVGVCVIRDGKLVGTKRTWAEDWTGKEDV